MAICEAGRYDVKGKQYLKLLEKHYLVDQGLRNLVSGRRGGNRAYYQVFASILDSQTYQRELEPLKAVKDHYPKYIVTMDEIPMSEDGIKQINAMAFLLGEI